MNRNIDIKLGRSPAGGLALAGTVLVTASSAYAATAPDTGAAFGGITLPVAAGLVVALIGIQVWKRRTVLAVNSSANQKVSSNAPATPHKLDVAEEVAYDKFVAELRAGPPLPAGLAWATPEGQLKTASSNASTAPTGDKTKVVEEYLKNFFEWVPGHTVALQRLVAKCCQAKSPHEQQELVLKVREQVGILKKRAGIPELRPVWHLTIALDGLLEQLGRQINNTTRSTLRTVESAVGLLSDLCVAGLRADLADNPSMKLLMVEDDPISGRALCSAVKKAFDQPELAQSGEAALALARKQRYDLITLDVMMPGMDGFELCAKIRETEPNRRTPVLFITTLKDFDSRAKLLTVGGNEVMGKPFLTFEITVKALTLILRARLLYGTPLLSQKLDRNVSHSTPAVHWPNLAHPDSSDETPAPVELPIETGRQVESNATSSVLLPPAVYADDAKRSPNASVNPLSREFLSYIPTCVTEMKQSITLLCETEDCAARREIAVRLHLRLQTLSRKIEVPELRPAFELCRSLEGLLKKFTENPKNLTDSALNSATVSLDLLTDLCISKVRADLAEKPPIKILVVDDEPLARRALTGALQMAFARPASVESGAAALDLAGEQHFDVVFTDVCMPEMDGYSFCTKIHETSRNRFTPVVFVTGHSDDEFRAKAAECGGSDFVVKPFIFMEINLKALTIALRGRLELDKLTQPLPTPVAA